MRVVKADLGELPAVQIPLRHFRELWDAFVDLVGKERNNPDAAFMGLRDSGRQEISIEHAATISALCSAFPGSRVIAFKMLDKSEGSQSQ